MHIFNIDQKEVFEENEVNWYHEKYNYLILCSPDELKVLQKVIRIDDVTIEDCLNFDESIRLDIFDKYDFLTLNTFEFVKSKIVVKEVNIYISDKFVITVVDNNHFLHKYIKNIMQNKFYANQDPSSALLQINYLILRAIIINGFEVVDKLEDEILKLEDEIISNIKEEHFQKISDLRSTSRTIVKYTRPLTYIGDRIDKENMKHIKDLNLRNNLAYLQNIDQSIDKLYNFALSTRELADKLLDIYTSGITEQTNVLINKLTVITVIAAPLTIITGIYGMNFKYMPELEYVYAYPLTIIAMILIAIIIFFFFKKRNML